MKFILLIFCFCLMSCGSSNEKNRDEKVVEKLNAIIKENKNTFSLNTDLKTSELGILNNETYRFKKNVEFRHLKLRAKMKRKQEINDRYWKAKNKLTKLEEGPNYTLQGAEVLKNIMEKAKSNSEFANSREIDEIHAHSMQLEDNKKEEVEKKMSEFIKTLNEK